MKYHKVDHSRQGHHHDHRHDYRHDNHYDNHHDQDSLTLQTMTDEHLSVMLWNAL